ncbi:MAG: acyl-CoA thioesterase [Desulfovibrionaceae bacterium]|nr:acyl-CoA thioesterase [Desulfovibrionaceae bacterium]MBF0512947.1 acyl-CoA thioesterase [Desulfovibrionaceae bacterium]
MRPEKTALTWNEPVTVYRQYVSYGETDAMGVVYYANYAHFFERARGQLIRERGMSYAEVERRGVILPVRELKCRYFAPARYDDAIAVRCAVGLWGRASMTFIYEVRCEAPGEPGGPAGNKLLCAGETQHACVGPDYRPKAVPDWLRELFATA